MINSKKTVQDILQDEMLRERAAVLARAGERLADALEKLEKIDREIGEGNGGSPVTEGAEGDRGRQDLRAQREDPRV